MGSLLSVKVAADSSEGDVGFSVSAQLPANQSNSSVTYFDLHMKPGAEQVLEVLVSNTSPDPIEVEVMAITASTNRNGIIDYKTPDIKDSSMKVAFSDIAKPLESTLIIPGNTTQTAKIQITMPTEEYDGQTGTVIQNRYNYIIGVQLSETKTQVAPDFEMVSVTPSIINARRSIANVVRNNAPIVIKNMQISAKISKEGETDVLLENSMENADMAPNSVISFPVDLGSTTLDPGKYVSRVHVEWDGQIWNFETPLRFLEKK